MGDRIDIRDAHIEDCKAMWMLIHDLAVYEKAGDQVEITVQDLKKDGFGDQAKYKAIVAVVAGQVIGMALYYFKYSTWKGPCLYLEDLVVKQDFRQLGLGQRLFNAVVAVAAKKQVKRLEWQVLEWNEPAILFYLKNKAVLDPEWINCKLIESQINAWKYD